MLQTIVVDDARDLAEQASVVLLATIRAALAERNAARIILAGGSTPRETYRLLADGIAREGIPVDHLLWLFGDERWVDRDDQQSNEGMARGALLRPIGAPERTILTWKAGKGDPVDCAAAYEASVTSVMGTAAGTLPDLLVLGLGADGHTASLFPGATAVLPGGRRVPVGPDLPGTAAAVEGEAPRGWRLTLCPVFLRTSRSVLFLVAGRDKEAALKRVRHGDVATPGAWIRGRQTHIFATRDAMGPEAADFGREVRHA